MLEKSLDLGPKSATPGTIDEFAHISPYADSKSWMSVFNLYMLLPTQSWSEIIGLIDKYLNMNYHIVSSLDNTKVLVMKLKWKKESFSILQGCSCSMYVEQIYSKHDSSWTHQVDMLSMSSSI